MMRFNQTVVAGTFDHLHLGHQKLLTAALTNGRAVSVGLTTKKFVRQKPLSSLIEDYRTRLHSVKKFSAEFQQTPHVLAINDPLGPAPRAADLDAIVCTPDTKANVDKINQLRQLNRLWPLTPIVIDLIPSSDHKPLSSTRIRSGEVNRQGFAFHQFFSNYRRLTLPDYHRHYLQKPFSTLLPGSQTNLAWAGVQAKQMVEKIKPFLTIAVGDLAVLTLLTQNVAVDLAIIDAKTRRQPYLTALNRVKITHFAANPASTITLDLVRQLQTCLTANLNQKTGQALLVDGEEDLTVLPAILLSPLKTIIFYGQPDQGLVGIRVSEKTKAKALKLLQKFI